MHETPPENIVAKCDICGLGYGSKAKAVYCRRLHPVGSTPGSVIPPAIEFQKPISSNSSFEETNSSSLNNSINDSDGLLIVETDSSNNFQISTN